MSRWPNKYVIGLTGNIGVGKSVVRQMAQHLGAYPIDADALVHQTMAPGAPAYKPILQTFGQFILDEEQRINRTMLAQIVFSNPAALAKLEAITHPIVRQAIAALVTRAKQRVVIVEAIKLLDGDLKDAVDEVWVVDAKPETQYKRLVEKRKMSPDDAKRRIQAQGAQADKLKQANVVIRNEDNIEETWKQVQNAWNKIMQKLKPEETSAAGQPQAPAPSQPTAQPKAATPPPPSTSTPAAQSAPQPAATAQPAAATPAVSARMQNQIDAENEEENYPAVDMTGVNIRRGMPSVADGIAAFINKHSGQNLSRMDVIMAFGQKSYLLAQGDSDQIIGMLGWQVENLITRVDEFYIDPSAKKDAVIFGLLKAMEEASKELQSEVGFVFLPGNYPEDMIAIFRSFGYEPTTAKEIKIPAWREALQESGDNNNLVLHKKLRKDRVLKPI